MTPELLNIYPLGLYLLLEVLEAITWSFLHTLNLRWIQGSKNPDKLLFLFLFQNFPQNYVSPPLPTWTNPKGSRKH